MRIAIMGSGGIGAYYGGRLAAEAGLEVPVNRTMYAALKQYAHGAP